ncbi:MobF family relaxase [Nocardia sp. XZ_19_369]|uniref:MobF family relaxase n=1 Tax=Nocardia sp. XZ_19_369 TaxID=2769487 RepID=UPI001E5F442C|nr:MobF family relaxase [Nocardia sp. XZ_19_369]
MTSHVIHSGAGYRYLTRTVAAGDIPHSKHQDLSIYYHVTGTPPGVWSGRAAELLGVAGVVTTAQMKALFGDGVHPNADQMVAEATDRGIPTEMAVAATQLGSPFYAFGGAPTPITDSHDRLVAEFRCTHGRGPDRHEWARLRRDAAVTHLSAVSGREPTAREVQKALAGERGATRRSVAAHECAFTGPGSVAKVLVALGDDAVREMIWQADREAIRETLAFAEQQYAIVRRGRGGVRRIDAQGWTVAEFVHWDNRCGDPDLHTHAVISAKVLGVDGKWSCLDARGLIHATASLSCRYNATLIGKLTRRLGVQFEERSRGRGKKPVLEVAGIPEELIRLFSSRRAEIEAATEDLVADYRRNHGRSPSKATQYQLSQQATLATRGGKPAPRTLAEMLDEWDVRATEWLASTGDHRTGREFVADLLAGRSATGSRFQPRSVAVEAGVAAGEAAMHAGDRQALVTAVDDQLHRISFPTPAARSAAREQVLALLEPGHPNAVLAEVIHARNTVQRRVFDAEPIAAEVVETVATYRATWCETHIRAAVEDRLALCTFADDAAHRAAVEQVVALVRDRHSVQLSVDPDPVPHQLRRRNGDSVFTHPSSTTVRYTSEAVLAGEAALQDAAVGSSAHFLPTGQVSAAIASVEQAATKNGVPQRLTVGQQRFVQHLCRAGTRLAVAIGPAGAGKTTALAAVVRAWRDDGREVIALSPQKSAARVLSRDIGIPADTVASLLWAHRHGLAPPIPAGAMILIDEAGMASTADLVAVQRLADEAGAVVRWSGDPWQLSAVEAGGALRLIATDTRAPELDTVVRFADPDEAAASLHVRNGDTGAAWMFYRDHDRVHSGLDADLRARMLRAHLADLDAGLSSLMMAATIEDVFRLNGAAQKAHVLRGTVDSTGAFAGLADGHHGYVGDLVVTRRNARRLRVFGGGRDGSPVTNGDRWQIVTVHTDGSLTVTGLDCRGRVHLPAWYVREDVELGYACTVHRAQGLTVDRAHLLMNTTLGRALAYVGLSRGRLWNGLYLATDTLPGPPPPERAPQEPLTDAEVFVQVLARQDDNISATETLREELARFEDPERLHEIYTQTCLLLGRQRAAELLDRALPAVLFHEVRRGGAFDSLADALTRAEQIGLDVAALIHDITTNDGADERGETLLTARDAAAVLCARANRHITIRRANTVPVPVSAEADAVAVSSGSGQLIDAPGAPGLAASTAVGGGGRVDAVAWLPARHPGVDVDLADYAQKLRSRLPGPAPVPPHLDDATAPPVDTEGPESTAGTGSVDDLVDPHDRLRRDYEFYARQLAREHARYRLDCALPAPVMQRLVDARSWVRLVDTIALAHAHDLDTATLVTAITRGDLDVVLHAHDSAALLRARADAWIATRTATSDTPASSRFPSRFRALRDLPAPAGLTPIPPEHPGMDTVAADYADALRQALLDLPADAPDWRARTRTATLREGLPGAGPVSPVDLAADLVADPGAEDGDDGGGGSLEGIDVAAARTDQLYPELDPLERVVRVRADMAAAQSRVSELQRAFREERHEHQLAITPLVARCRERVDALRPLLLAYRDAQQDWEQAHAATITAEDTYRQALSRQPEQADEQFLKFLSDKATASTANPGARARLHALLDKYREAMTERADAATDAEITHTKLLAEDARAWADRLRAEADAAERELHTAAGAEGVVDESDLHRMRLLGDELAIETITDARAALRRLPPYLNRARSLAASELEAAEGLSRSEALAEVDRRTADEVPADREPHMDLEPLGEVAGEVDEQLAEHMRADPIRMRTDNDLDTLIRSLRHSAAHTWPVLTDPATSLEQQVRGNHARLAKQVAAIAAAQRAAEDGDQHAAEAAVAAAAAAGAPRHRWSALLARAADTHALAQELAEAQLADGREEQLRTRAEQRAAHAAHELTVAMAERHRRNRLHQNMIDAENRVRAAHGAPTSTAPGELASEPSETAQLPDAAVHEL